MTEPYRMPPWRRLLVSVGLAALLLGSAFDMLTGREHWPFSPYPMFSEIELDTSQSRLFLHGVPADTSRAAFPLRDADYLAPYSPLHLHIALGKIRRRTDGTAQLRTAARDVLARYEARRQSGAHDGPALRAVRVVRYHWRLDATGANLNTPATRVLFEVEAASPSPSQALSSSALPAP